MPDIRKLAHVHSPNKFIISTALEQSGAVSAVNCVVALVFGAVAIALISRRPPTAAAVVREMEPDFDKKAFNKYETDRLITEFHSRDATSALNALTRTSNELTTK